MTGVKQCMDNQESRLWELLGRAPRPDAPPFFAGKVMRAIREPETRSPGWLAPALRWLAPASVAALLLLAVWTAKPVADEVATTEFTTLDLVGLLSPDDYQVLTDAGWPYNNGFLSASL